MVSRIVKTLTHNLGYKILALVLAFVLWLAVYNIDDPKLTKTYTASVTIENTAVITNQNKCFEILDGSNSVTFPVTGKRSILKNLDDTDFRATADINRMVLEEDGTVASIPIEIRSIRSNSSLSYPSKKFLKIGLEDLMSKRLVITAGTTGTVASGYTLGDVVATNPNVLKISGPASVVSSVSSAVATIDVEGMSVNLMDNVIPKLYDSEGNEVDTTRLTLSNSKVTVSAKILVIKEVPLKFGTVGKPGGDYNVVDVTSDPAVVSVKGSASAINVFPALEVPEELIDVTGIREDMTTMIDITEYLPEDISLLNAEDGRVSVTVRVEPFVTERFPVETSRIQVEGLDESDTLSFMDTTVFVSVSALQSDLSRLGRTSLIGRIDVGELEDGVHLVELELNLDSEVYVYHPILVQVRIDLPEEPEGDNPTDNENPSENEGEDSSEQVEET